MMERALNELKTQAKKLLKSCKQHDSEALARIDKWHKYLQVVESDLKLKHCQLLLAKELGFSDWQHIQKILSGGANKAKIELNFGSLFHSTACSAFINQWFAHYDDAKKASDGKDFIFPYKRQFIVASTDYMQALGLTEMDLKSSNEQDLFACYPSDAWDDLTLKVLKSRRI